MFELFINHPFRTIDNLREDINILKDFLKKDKNEKAKQLYQKIKKISKADWSHLINATSYEFSDNVNICLSAYSDFENGDAWQEYKNRRKAAIDDIGCLRTKVLNLQAKFEKDLMKIDNKQGVDYWRRYQKRHKGKLIALEAEVRSLSEFITSLDSDAIPLLDELNRLGVPLLELDKQLNMSRLFQIELSEIIILSMEHSQLLETYLGTRELVINTLGELGITTMNEDK